MQARAITCLRDGFTFALKADLDYDGAPGFPEHRGLGLWGDAVRFAWAMRYSAKLPHKMGWELSK